MQVFIQGYDVTVMDYVEYFMALVGVAETYGGAYGNKPGLLREQLIKQGVSAVDVDKTVANGGPDAAEIEKALVVTRKCYLSCMILQGSHNSRFYQVKTDLQNNMTRGPTTSPRLSSKQLAPQQLQGASKARSCSRAGQQGSGIRAGSRREDARDWHD